MSQRVNLTLPDAIAADLRLMAEIDGGPSATVVAALRLLSDSRRQDPAWRAQAEAREVARRGALSRLLGPDPAPTADGAGAGAGAEAPLPADWTDLRAGAGDPNL